MPRLRSCSHCGVYVKSNESTCPFCDAPIASRGTGAAAVVLAGLAFVGCEKKGGAPVPPPEPEYGVPISDSAGVDDGAAPPADGGSPPSDDGGAVEPEYGVVEPPPEPPVEPKYGVVDPG